MTTADVLRKARALYAANPSHAIGGPPSPGTFCVIYAISEVADDDAYRSAIKALADAADAPYIVKWNAEHTTEEVLAAFDRAIKDAQ